MGEDYMQYRGRCKEMCEALIKEDPSLKLVRGYYYDAFWGNQQHWWCVSPDGEIIDPTAKQFPTKGRGEYIPFDGTIICDECGKTVPEDRAYIDGRYAFCSYKCNGKFVGVF